MPKVTVHGGPSNRFTDLPPVPPAPDLAEVLANDVPALVEFGEQVTVIPLVGERGPELVDVPSGSVVEPEPSGVGEEAGPVEGSGPATPPRKAAKRARKAGG
jgi:hypothetical protein